MPILNRTAVCWMVSVGALGIVGCTDRPAFFPNADPNLRHSAADFAADATNRHYEAGAPRGGDANGRAEVDYGSDRIYLANTSSSDWTNVELWLNKNYVIFLPRIPGRGARSVDINFTSIYNSSGEHFPLNSTQTPIDTVELFLNGKMYNVTMALAD